jgi:phospholipase/carboxylesterase
LRCARRACKYEQLGNPEEEQAMPQDGAVVIEPAGAGRSSVIWLHGLGADGHDFEPIVPELQLPAELGVRFIFPHAPRRPVTINGGLVMRAWYDVRYPDLTQDEDADAIDASAAIANGYIEAERARGIPAGRIVLAGFSQGGAIALHAGLRQPQQLAGILALSCYLPLPERLPAEAHPASRNVPILMLHGNFDPIIPLATALHSRDRLRAVGYPLEWRAYPMAHAVCAQEIMDIGAWLATRFEG